MKILWIADQPDDKTILPLLESYSFKFSSSLSEAVFELNREREPFDACLVHLPLAEDDPMSIVQGLLRAQSALPIVFIHPDGGASEAVKLLKFGANHYFDYLPSSQEISDLLDHLPRRQNGAATTASFSWRNLLVGDSPAMQRVAEVISLIAPRRSTVLIMGETGSGKEVVARALHLASPRADRRLVPVNCAAIPENLLEAELFGHVRGAFTGATNARAGRFEQADGGTLFLDEIADMPLDLQAKLLRVLQEREFQRVGSSETVRVDVRLIAATNVNLLDQVTAGKFREDLYYRLNVVPIKVPPLRYRPGDIPALVQHFIQKICDHERLCHKSLSEEALQRLCMHPWPGNVRQLENAVEMAIVLSGDRNTLLPSDFSLPTQGVKKHLKMEDEHIIDLPETGLDFEQVIARIELNLLEQALQRSHGNKKLAAEILGLKRTTLAAKLKSLEAFS